MESTVRQWFDAWLMVDDTQLDAILADDAVYTRIGGTRYRGKEQIRRWFRDRNAHGSVMQWRAKNFIERGGIMAVEWYMSCNYDETTDSMNGVSIVEFDDDGKICAMREFRASAEHRRAYSE